MTHLPVQFDFPLQRFNTFGVAATARAYLPITDISQLCEVRKDASLTGLPRLVLGGGSNLLLTKDFSGLVLHMQLHGIERIGEDETHVFVRAAAGENWHGFVQSLLAQGLGGLENLSLIPGTVGAAPIQNIGAYGVEIKDLMHSLRYFDFDSGEVLTVTNAECEFGYRDSIFKHRLQNRAAVIDVTFALPKQWKPNMAYADVERELASHGIADPSPRDISAAVIAIRSRKLPDPAVIGNAGSFFKNPIVSATKRHQLMMSFPNLVSYAQADGDYKLAAGWLIDQCGWKGKSIGAAGVYRNQALVLVNLGGATGAEIAALADAVRRDVESRFGVLLEPEPVYL